MNNSTRNETKYPEYSYLVNIYGTVLNNLKK